MSLPRAEDLWPNLDHTIGRQPCFPLGNVWSVLPTIKGQLDDVLREIGSKIPEGVNANEEKGLVHIEDGVNIEECVYIIGPAFIGSGATIRHGAYIREYSWICSDAMVGHASEIKHSVLLPKSKAPHFNYVGDSILGPGVNLGAGVKLSNLRNDGKEVHTIYEDERIPTGLRKFGAILGENCQLGCNAVTNPGVVLGANSIVMPNSTITGIHPQGSKLR
ncbi:MAG: hypothetical protein QGI21_05335 [Candidatus Poseidoniaceae archaeon]|nr:hypothetical protein [Candidatus Poseidoniaceae archaeon]